VFAQQNLLYWTSIVKGSVFTSQYFQASRRIMMVMLVVLALAAICQGQVKRQPAFDPTKAALEFQALTSQNMTAQAMCRNRK
jgi:hypothetical protein